MIMAVEHKHSAPGKPALHARGFTLVELLVALAMSALVLLSVFRLSLDQQKVHLSQDQVAQLQQNIRAAMDLLTRDIRMAGYDPTKKANARCISGSATNFHFTMDLNSDGDCSDINENVTFSLTTDDEGIQHLGRKSSSDGAVDLVIPNLEGIEFYYTLADGTQTSSPISPNQIRLVQISLLVKTSRQDEDYINQTTYSTPSGTTWGPFDDHSRRRFLTTTVLCQNMGL